MEVGECPRGNRRESGLQEPGQRKGGRESGPASLLRQEGGLASLEEAIRRHQDADQREQEDRVRGAIGQPDRRKEQPPDDGDSHAEEDDRRCVIPYCIVQSASPGGIEPVRDTYCEEGESPAHQDQKAGKDQNVNDTGKPVPRMPPLRQPELQNPAQPVQRPVETEITLRTEQRRQAPRGDIGKTGQPQEVEEEE